MIIGLIIGGLLLLFLVAILIAAFILLKRRKSSTNKKSSSPRMYILSNPYLIRSKTIFSVILAEKNSNE